MKRKIFFESVITNTALYGSCAWTMNNYRRAKLVSAQSKTIREIHGLYWWKVAPTEKYGDYERRTNVTADDNNKGKKTLQEVANDHACRPRRPWPAREAPAEQKLRAQKQTTASNLGRRKHPQIRAATQSAGTTTSSLYDTKSDTSTSFSTPSSYSTSSDRLQTRTNS